MNYETKRFRGIVSLVGLLVIVMFVLAGCSGEKEIYRVKTVYDCPNDNTEQRVDFILKCIENANPKSDEEPEDWIYMCENMALKAFCTARTIKVNFKKDCYSCMYYQTGVVE